MNYLDHSPLLRKLVLEKLDANRLAGRTATLNKGPGAASDGARGGVKADAGGTHQPTVGGVDRPMGMRKSPAAAGAVVRDIGLAKREGFAFAYEVHTNPAMSGMPMRQTTQSTRAMPPRGVVSLMVIEGGKR